MLPDPVDIAAHSPTAALTFRVKKQIPGTVFGTERQDDTGAFTILTTHERNPGANRHYIKVTQTKDATDPYSGTTKKKTSYVSMSVSVSPFGWTAAEAAALVAVLTDYLADSQVTVANFLNFES